MHIVLIEFRNSTPYPVLLANALAEHCEVTLMLSDKTTFSNAVDRSRVNLRLFPIPRLRQIFNMAMIRRLFKEITQINPDLVHVTFWNPWIMPAMAMFLKFPLVCTTHDVERHPGERGLWAIPSFLYRWQWQWADQVIVHATKARQQLITQYGCQPDTVHSIPIGSYNFYRSAAASTEKERPDTILFFGRIWGYKGLQYLIEAEPLITQAVPNAKIIIAGQGESFEKYRQLMVNPQHFEVHNYRIPNEQVAHFFQQASVIALPYTEASQSGVTSVAYAFGKPVVATNVGGLSDVVIDGKTGLLVPPKDSQSLAKAIIDLLQDPKLRQKMGRQAQQFAETELSWQSIAQKTLEVYQNVLL